MAASVRTVLVTNAPLRTAVQEILVGVFGCGGMARIQRIGCGNQFLPLQLHQITYAPRLRAFVSPVGKGKHSNVNNAKCRWLIHP